MRYSTFLKFVAVILCAASLLGIVAGGVGIVALTELGGKSVEQQYADQVENRALNYALSAGEEFASRELGGAHENLISRHIGRGSDYFDWTRVGYAIRDDQGNVLQEKPMPDDDRGVEYEFAYPLMGRYMKVLSAAPYVEVYPQATEPARMEAQVTVMPAQERTAVHAVIVDYTDGSRQEWRYDGTQRGSLVYEGGSDVTFLSNIGELPMGDGWYPNHILFADSGGNIVYEAYDDEIVILGSSLDGSSGMIEWYLPAGTVTMTAPVGISYTEGEYTAYDAVPTQGSTVTSMNVTYANAEGEVLGSEGIASPDLIGTVFHDHQGNVEFHSNEQMTMDIPENSIITRITFVDVHQNMIFEASCPAGIGVLEQDEQGYLVFRGQMPGTEVPEATEPEVEAAEAPTIPVLMTVAVGKDTMIYNMPSPTGIVLEILEADQELDVLQKDTFDGTLWGLTAKGWILLPEEEPVPELARNLEPEAAEAPVPEETEAATEPVEETAVPVTEPIVIPEMAEDLPAATEPASLPEADVEKGIYYDGQEMIAEYVWETIPEGYTITVQLAPGAMRDEFVWLLLRLAEGVRHILLEAVGICVAVFVLCVVHLCCSAGRTRRNHEVRAGGLNRIPLDLYLVGGISGCVLLGALAYEGSKYLGSRDGQLAVVLCGASGYLVCLLLVGFFFAFVAQIKTPGGFWWRNTLCGWICRYAVKICAWLVKICKKWSKKGLPLLGRFFHWAKEACIDGWFAGKKFCLWAWDTGKRLWTWFWDRMKRWSRWCLKRAGRLFSLLPVTWQFLATGFVLVFLLYIMMRTYKVGYILLGFGIFFAVILYAASAFGILLESARKMSKGDLDTKVDDRMLIGGFKDFAGELNDLADVAVIAAQKQLKSERMKTELITNVSHDIKTPLTSIINYVDLLQKPHTEQQQEQYLEVLDRQSQRLKKLIDDLMEMSKASTGNMTVEIQRMDAAETVNQVLGEFADKLERAQLTSVFRQPEEQIFMMADGRLVWRVMSNLLGNAVKYALPGTRVYLDLMEMDGKVILSMKNISREELNVNAEELLERFVRGDASRNTEGSGLGLNIAKSLMELQKGQLEILVDGDLFKVTLVFPSA